MPSHPLRPALLLASALVLPAAEGVTSGPGPVTAAVPWADYLAALDPVWNRMPKDYYEGPFVGNGLVGTILFADAQEPGALRFELGRTDVYDHREGGNTAHERARLPIGQLLLKPVGKITGVALRTDLWNAEVRGRLTTSAGTIDLRVFAPSGGEVVAITSTATGDEAKAAWSLRPQQGNSGRYTVQPDRDKNYVYKVNPPVQTTRIDGVEVAVQPLLAGGDYATAWSDTTAADGTRTVLATTAYRWAVKKTPLEGSAADAVATLRTAQATPMADLEQQHRAWWHAYYPASFVTLPDARQESFYWIQLYKMASATRADRPVVDLMGPWFKPSVWAAYWQNLNTQLPYYLPDVVNHPELCEAPSALIERRTADLIANVPKEWQADSAALGNPTGYDSLRANAPGPAKAGPTTAYHFIALPWLMQQFYLHCRFTADDARLKATVYPLLKRSIFPYLHTVRLGDDGRYHIPLAFSDEYGNAEDTNLNLALLRWGLETLLATAMRLDIADPDKDRYLEVLSKLVDYPVDPATGYMIGKGEPFAKSHRHYSHLFAIFPLYTLNVESQPAAKPVIETSLRQFTGLVGDECLFKFTGAASLWASIGNGDEALRWIERSFEILPKGPTMGPNTLYSENGWPTFESPISGARAQIDLLLQSWGGAIRVFPALPSTWKDVAFHDLRAEGAFLVSAARRHGATAFVRVKSLAGEPCRLRTDLAAPIRILGRPGTLTPEADGALHLRLPAGEEAVLVSGEANPDLVIRPVAMPRTPTWGLP